MKTLHLAGAALAVALAPALALAGPNDAQIAAIVVTANQVDIDAGAYAQAPAGADDVKAFARQMVTDHTAVNKSATDLAGKLHLAPEDKRQLDALPAAFRSVFVLRAVEELSVEETAQLLAIPEATVRSRHFRARSLLREALAQEIDLAERDLYAFGGAHCDRTVAAVLFVADRR